MECFSEKIGRRLAVFTKNYKKNDPKNVIFEHFSQKDPFLRQTKNTMVFITLYQTTKITKK